MQYMNLNQLFSFIKNILLKKKDPRGVLFVAGGGLEPPTSGL